MLPSPACSLRIGETVKGKKKLDMYGDAVQATCLPGDHWRTRHDLIKNVIFRLCVWAGLPSTVEVFNMFSGLLTQTGLARIDKDRDRQALVPDFKITLTIAGQSVPTLHELKTISSSRSRYKVTLKEGGVKNRAKMINEENIPKAGYADVLYGGAREGEPGRVEQKLLSYPKVVGLVFGNWGEASDGVHNLVEQMARSRAKVAEPQAKKKGGRLTEEGVKALAVGFIRRRLSVAAVRAQCLSLLGRLEVMGPGLTTASGRRRAAADQEGLWRRERVAQELADKLGYSGLRRGFPRLD